jgi:G3E family GTPase
VWRARRPVHPERFKRFIEGDLPGVVRAKGFFWLATRMPWAGEWQLAGAIGRHEAAGFWWAAQPASRWPDDPAWRATIEANWQEPHGDRRQEIVFIGIGMDEAGLRAALQNTLLTDEEWRAGPRTWARLPDPFPTWREG